MARPRVFIGSTFYDLRQVRADLERFIKEIGYDPVLNERGSIPFDKTERLEESCYQEVELSDIMVAIVGGRYGTGSQHQPYSISQMELKRALETGKQVYVFVERSVLAEYSTYLNNKDVKGFRPQFADNLDVYRFLEEVYALPINNPIAPFETSAEITNYLREQWAGLMHRFLQEQTRLRDVRVSEEIKNTAETLNKLVTFLTEERRSKDKAIKEILLTTHPVFERIRKLLKVSYRVFFTNRNELNEWLKARSYIPVDSGHWDSPDFAEWLQESKNTQFLLKIFADIFDENGRLKVYTADEWKQEWIALETRPVPSKAPADDNIPF